MIKAILFDMDGVLIDTVELGFRTRKKVLARYNVDLDTVPDPQGENHRATSLKSLLENVKSQYGIHIDHDEVAAIIREGLHDSLREHGITADPGLIALLDDLKKRDIICAIVSSGLPQGIAIKLSVLGIADYFSYIVTGNDVAEHKPHPESYLFAMKELGLSLEDCVVFEDSLTGIQAAQAAGCRVIGFTQYNPPKEPLAGVLTTVDRWNDVTYDMLEQLINRSEQA